MEKLSEQLEKQVKAIQSKLSRRDLGLSIKQIRQIVQDEYPGVEMLSAEQLESIVNSQLPSQLAAVQDGGNLQAQVGPDKNELIQQVAGELSIDLPIETLNAISNQIDWAINDRAMMKTEIKAALQKWIDYQLQQDEKDSKRLISETRSHFQAKIQQANTQFETEASELTAAVTAARDNFRGVKQSFLQRIKVPD